MQFGRMAVSSSKTDIAIERQCDLCSLPARQPVVYNAGEVQKIFCCPGCQNVWRILLESGTLEGFDDPRESQLYKQALAAGLIGENSGNVEIAHPEANHEFSVERKGGSLDDNRKCVLQIGGMWCSSCSWLIRQTLLRLRGVVAAEVSFASDTASVIYKPAKTDETELTQAVKSLGYTAAPLGESNDLDPRMRARRKDLLRVVICIIFAMNAMMTQLILYAGYFEGISRSIRNGVPWLLLALSIPVFVSAGPIFVRAFKAAEQRVTTMETLISLGAVAALGYSVWQTVVGSGHVYYDTADMLLGLVMVGKHIETGARQNASDALSLLYGLLPNKAVLLKDNVEYPVAISHLVGGDRILVKAGERIAADGLVEDGSGTVDESLLSGESRPVAKHIGDRAIGGTMLMNGVLTVSVDHTGTQGTFRQIISHVEEALTRKTPVEQMADRVSRFFVPSVLLLALSTGAVLALFSHVGADMIMTRVVAILVIACPCALGIATPMAISAGIAIAARNGVLVSDGGAFEMLNKADLLIFDSNCRRRRDPSKRKRAFCIRGQRESGRRTRMRPYRSAKRIRRGEFVRRNDCGILGRKTKAGLRWHCHGRQNSCRHRSRRGAVKEDSHRCGIIEWRFRANNRICGANSGRHQVPWRGLSSREGRGSRPDAQRRKSRLHGRRRCQRRPCPGPSRRRYCPGIRHRYCRQDGAGDSADPRAAAPAEAHQPLSPNCGNHADEPFLGVHLQRNLHPPSRLRIHNPSLGRIRHAAEQHHGDTEYAEVGEGEVRSVNAYSLSQGASCTSSIPLFQITNTVHPGSFSFGSVIGVTATRVLVYMALH
jgi:copper chaperone CopZ